MKSLGLVSFLYFGAGVAYMLHRWPADLKKTYSQNAARTQGSIVYYGVLVLTFVAMLCTFAYSWLIPALHLSVVFTSAFSIGAMAQAVAGIVPETHGCKTRVHVNAAYVMYYSTVVMVVALVLGISMPAKLLVVAMLVLMAAAVAVGTFSAKLRQHAVILQTIHFVALAGAFLFATYL
jgi:hypothetical protein